MKIYNNLKKYRIWKGLTRKEMSNLTDVSISMIHQIESKNKYPRYIVRSKLCKFLGISPNQLFYKKKEDD